MDDKEKEAVLVQDNMVVTMEYRLTVDGEIIEETTEDEPIQFILGIGQLIPGLEREIYGLRIGDIKAIHVLPKDGYGDFEEEDEAFAEIPIDQFPDDVPVEPDIEVLLQDDEGDELEAYITKVDGGLVYLSLNHPLAGKELDFEIKIVDLRPATDEELDHEHVHFD